MAAGMPVFGLRGGGLLETNVEDVTGEFFDVDSVEDFVEKFQIFHENISAGKYDPKKIQFHALKF
jgi:glycosyltransferase involved in cell wall biosynthesis